MSCFWYLIQVTHSHDWRNDYGTENKRSRKRADSLYRNADRNGCRDAAFNQGRIRPRNHAPKGPERLHRQHDPALRREHGLPHLRHF